MTVPRVSIIIPTYQRRDLLDETLASIEAQTWTDWECLVIDDGSTDGTKEMFQHRATTDPRFRWIEKPSSRPRGPAASRNLGLEAATGTFVQFFDSDDLLPPDHLRSCLELLEPSSADLLVCRIRFFPDNHPDEPADSPPMVAEDFIGRAIAGDHAIFTQNAVWRRTHLQTVAPMREDLTMVEDLEYAVRALLTAKPPILADGLRVLVRRHAVSLTFDPSPSRFVQRNLHMYDAYHAIVRSLASHGTKSARADAYCAKRRYDLVVEVLKRGFPSFGIARRYIHLLSWSIVERRPRPLLRLTFLAPIFWTMAFRGAMARRSAA